MRILALTRNASLLVALGSMMRDWEVVSANDVQSASSQEPGSVVALIDFGPTQDGLTAATELYQSGITIPCVVLGDEPGGAPNAIVLVRPFSLEDLATAVSDASTRPAIAPQTHDAPAAIPVSSKAAPSPGNGSSQAPEEPSQPAVTAVGDEPAGAKQAEPAAHVETSAPVEEPKQPAKTRPLTVVRPDPYEDLRELPAADPSPAPPETVAEPIDESEPEPAFVPDPAPASAPVVVAPPSAQRVEPAPRAPAQTFAASAAQTAPAPQEPAQAGRWRLRRKPAASPARSAQQQAEPPLVQHLRQAARNAADLEKLIEELPFLADLSSMADGLVAEVESQFSALVASVYVERADGFRAIAHRGLSRVESGMVVPVTQPLFSDVLQTGEGILIQPVDLAQGLVAGIGGARTEAIMAVPAVERGECVAVIIVGHDHFNETDLDQLTALANEAAPGLAVALALTRLRERL